MKTLFNRRNRFVRRTRIAIALAKRNNVYQLLFQNIFKAAVSILLIIGLILILKRFILEGSEWFIQAFKSKPLILFGIFFLSESFLGLLPPEFFILWTVQQKLFIPLLILLAVLSYSGVLFSFFRCN